MPSQPQIKRFTIVCGHYGCGKTNLSLNLALDCARRGEKVLVADMDVVNPYFRSCEYADLLKSAGISMVAPVFAHTTLDVPAISAQFDRVFSFDGTVIIDAGGDDVGATVLGTYAAKIRIQDYDLLYVVNRARPLASSPEAAAVIAREIESSSRLKITAVANNTHLKEFTTAETVRGSMAFAGETAKLLGLPLRFTTAPRAVAAELPTSEIENLYPIDIYVRTPWGT